MGGQLRILAYLCLTPRSLCMYPPPTVFITVTTLQVNGKHSLEMPQASFWPLFFWLPGLPILWKGHITESPLCLEERSTEQKHEQLRLERPGQGIWFLFLTGKLGFVWAGSRPFACQDQEQLFPSVVIWSLGWAWSQGSSPWLWTAQSGPHSQTTPLMNSSRGLHRVSQENSCP